MFAEKLRLDGRVAVVTGGGQGIGLSCARALGEFGAVVVLADIDPAAACGSTPSSRPTSRRL